MPMEAKFHSFHREILGWSNDMILLFLYIQIGKGKLRAVIADCYMHSLHVGTGWSIRTVMPC